MTPEFVIANFTRAKKTHGKLEWRFKPKVGRNRWCYVIRFDAEKREFDSQINSSNPGTRPRRTVKKMSREITEALRMALPPEALALCAATSLARSAG
ncbi:MAG: hypothetical protein AB7S80_16745 [Rhizobiaceae bacterium]